jgi:chorismate synthase
MLNLKKRERIKGIPKSREDHAAIIEAIKVVDMMSALNIEDFQMNQWIFLIDSYGMRHRPDPSLI